MSSEEGQKHINTQEQPLYYYYNNFAGKLNKEFKNIRATVNALINYVVRASISGLASECMILDRKIHVPQCPLKFFMVNAIFWLDN